MAPTRKMVNLKIDETSGVDHPAHLDEGWLVIKSATEPELQVVFDESLTEEDSTMEKEIITDAIQEVEKAVDPELAKANKRIAELEAELAASKKEEDGEPEMPMKKASTEEEFLKSAPEPVVKMIEDLRKAATEATETLQKERDIQADKEAVAKAKAWTNLNLQAEKVGPALRKLSGIDPDLAKSLDETLSSLNAQAESANIFAELGKSVESGAGDSLSRMTALAKGLVEAGTATTMAKALDQVAMSNPDLYTEYINEKGA